MWAAYDWELNKFAHFFQTLYSISIQTGVEDKMFCSLGRNVCVHSFFEVLRGAGCLDFPWKLFGR